MAHAALPPTLPIPAAAQTYLWIRRPTETMELLARRYGTAFTVLLPPRRIAFFSDPDSIRSIFAARGDEMHAGKFNALLRPVVGPSSVLLLDGEEHMRQRRLLLPPFHGDRMRHYGAVMADVARRTVEAWPRGEPFSLRPHMQRVTLEIILRTVFGVAEGEESVELGEALRRMLAKGDVPVSPLVLFLLSARPSLEESGPVRFLLRERHRADALIRRQITRRRALAGAGAGADVLALLLAARDEHGTPMTDDEIRDELMTALVAGHETTATALCWAMERLLSTPEVRGRLRDEVRGAGGGGVPAPDAVERLPYLDATVKEALRLRPVLPVVGRALQRPATIGGWDLPEGQLVGACIWLAHRNPDVYPDPEAFRPERFLGRAPDPASWLPFGGGIRRCLGAAFAMYEMKIVLATLLSSAELSLAQPSPARVKRRAITLSPELGTRVVRH